MSVTIETLLAAPAGYRSPEVARFLWQMDEQHRSLLADVRGSTADELEWQLAPGMDTIGMLLAHIAYAENHLTQVGLEGKPTSDTRAGIGIGEEEEGLPLAAGATPSPALAGRPLAFFEELLARARAYTHRVAAGLATEDLDRQVVRQRADGTRRVFNLGWVLYHLLEHEAGHRAQINLLRHAYRIRGHRIRPALTRAARRDTTGRPPWAGPACVRRDTPQGTGSLTTASASAVR